MVMRLFALIGGVNVTYTLTSSCQTDRDQAPPRGAPSSTRPGRLLAECGHLRGLRILCPPLLSEPARAENGKAAYPVCRLEPAVLFSSLVHGVSLSGGRTIICAGGRDWAETYAP
jgi:hypothetical protein